MKFFERKFELKRIFYYRLFRQFSDEKFLCTKLDFNPRSSSQSQTRAEHTGFNERGYWINELDYLYISKHR